MDSIGLKKWKLNFENIFYQVKEVQIVQEKILEDILAALRKIKNNKAPGS